jgi:hypothetical protein
MTNNTGHFHQFSLFPRAIVTLQRSSKLVRASVIMWQSRSMSIGMKLDI